MLNKIFIIACETSGDNHAAHLVHELKRQHSNIEFRGLGGPKMQAEGVKILNDMTKISALGLGDVVRQYFTYRKIFYDAFHEVKCWRPQAIILVDSPAFNLRFAKKIRAWHAPLPIFYYISPQIWAWGARRIHTIKKNVTKMLCILPFEIELYQKAGVDCEFVGHPLLDEIHFSADRNALRKRFEINTDQKAIGILPGSRKKEVMRILPIMLEAASRLKKEISNLTFFLAQSRNVDKAVYDEIIQKTDIRPRFYDEGFYDHLLAMDFAFIASGTATLEAALIGTPYFLLYKTSWSTYLLGYCLIRVPFLGIVNLLARRKIIPEFIQENAHPETIAHEARVLLSNQELYERIKEEFNDVRVLLGNKGASERAAQAILQTFNQQTFQTQISK